MIVRHIPMKAIKQSSFAGLVRYITSEQGKQERLGEVHITNCQSLDINWAMHEVEATQYQNQRAQGDKTYHLLISFPAGETPSASVLKDIEERICVSIGYGEHQRISAVHYDTDNTHIHVAINKVHPTRFILHEPFRAYKVLGEMAAKLEIEHGLQRVNHFSKKVVSENRADDMEHHAGVESLLGWIRRECLEQIQGAQSWPELHEVMSKNGLELYERGSGLIITDRQGIAVKASSVSRNLSKPQLEKKHGPFERNLRRRFSREPPPSKRPGVGKVGQKPPGFRRNRLSNLSQLQSVLVDNGPRYSAKPVHMRFNTVELYARYQAEHSDARHSRSMELQKARTKKDRLIEQAKRTGRLKRAAIKLMKGRGVNKKALYAITSNVLKEEIEKVNAQYLKEREVIYKKYQRCAWADWLKLKALEGEIDALFALRSREARQTLKGNTITGNIKQNHSPAEDLSPDNITKTGTIIYRVGACAIRDDGESLKLSRGSSEEGLIAALQMAVQRFGECITVNGSDEFKEQIAQIAASLKLNITFDDAVLERYRQDLIQNPMSEEKSYEHRRQFSVEHGGANRGDNEGFRKLDSSGTIQPITRPGTRKYDDTRVNKPHVGRIGKHAPPTSKNGLRNLSQLGVVQLASRGEVLLPSDVSRHVEHEGTQRDNRVRRDVSGPGVKNLALAAADKYIAERELKRQVIADIPLHRRYHPGDEGIVQFSGFRQVDGETLALLKRDEQVIVLPIDAVTTRRMKGISLGDSLTLTSKGSLITRGRSR